MPRPIEIQKPLLGSHVVSYGCPHCDTHLKSPVEEIGQADFCPDCNRQFLVPGAKEWQTAQEEQHAAAAAKAAALESAKEEKRRKKEKEEADRLARARAEKQQKLIRPPELPRQLPPRQLIHAELVDAEPSPTQKRRCPFCSEEILATAVKCKHCGEFLDARMRQPPNQTVYVHERTSQPIPVYYQQPAQGGSGCNLIILIALGIVLGFVLLALL